MSSKSAQYLIETDVLAGYLVMRSEEAAGLLRLALRQAICYTTMLNALELFRAAEGEREQSAVLQLLNLVRVLGFNSRYAEPFAELAKTISLISGAPLSNREAMILGMARASKLTIVTEKYYDRYHKFESVAVVNRLSYSSSVESCSPAS